MASNVDPFYSRPLKKSEVPKAHELTDELLLQKYFSEGQHGEADRYWFFRPWFYMPPDKSGVYARRKLDGNVTFAYFDYQVDVWLLDSDSPQHAKSIGDMYRAIQDDVQRQQYLSPDQIGYWSEASLEGITGFGGPADKPDDMNVKLALLRWTTDPQRKLRAAG